MTLIIPQYKVIFTYDIKRGVQAEYRQFVLGTFVPGLQSLNLHIMRVYQTLHGDYPSRQAEFVAENRENMLNALQSEQFETLEAELIDYIYNYNRKVVKFRPGFQF
ncbi:MAG: hypothetical protein ACLFTK_02960 [Anaerolineales bacterium]